MIGTKFRIIVSWSVGMRVDREMKWEKKSQGALKLLKMLYFLS